MKNKKKIWFKYIQERKFPKVIYFSIHFDYAADTKALSTYFKNPYTKIEINIDKFVLITQYLQYWWNYLEVQLGEDASRKIIKEKILSSFNNVLKDFFSDNKDLPLLLLDEIDIFSDGERNRIIFKKGDFEFKNAKNFSYGERKIMSLILFFITFEINDSIILFDEPENGLHPYWQKKIIKLLKTIGNNNQIFIATHSPHLATDVILENIIFFTSDNGVNITYFRDELGKKYFTSTKRVLNEIMGVSERNDEVTILLKKVNESLDKKEFDSNEFINNYNKLISLIGEDDIEFLKLKLKKEMIIKDDKN